MDFAGAQARHFHSLFGHPWLWALSILLAPALWVGLVWTTNPHELLVGLLASGATVIFTFFVGRSSGIELMLRGRDLGQIWRIPWYIVSGVFGITMVLLKDLFLVSPAKNLYRVCAFDSSTDDPARIARTILAVAYTTTSPNFIVVDVDAKQSRMLFHQIERSSVPRMTKALGAGAALGTTG